MNDDQNHEEYQAANGDLRDQQGRVKLIGDLLRLRLEFEHEVHAGRRRRHPRQDRKYLARQAAVHSDQPGDDDHGDEGRIEIGYSTDHGSVLGCRLRAPRLRPDPVR